MSKAFRVDDGTDSLKAIIKLHLERLRERFVQSCSLEELTDMFFLRAENNPGRISKSYTE